MKVLMKENFSTALRKIIIRTSPNEISIELINLHISNVENVSGLHRYAVLTPFPWKMGNEFGRYMRLIFTFDPFRRTGVQ